MDAFTRGFADELTKTAAEHLGQKIMQLQMAAARDLLGVDPRTPVPFADSRLDDDVSKLRLQQRLIEMNRQMMGMPATDEKTAAGMGYMSPRMAKRVVLNSGYDDRDPGFQAIAQQLTGASDINRMTQPQLRTLVTLLTGRSV